MNEEKCHSAWLKLCIVIDRDQEGHPDISIVEEEWEDSPRGSFEATLEPEELEVFWEELAAWAEQHKKGTARGMRRDNDIADMLNEWDQEGGQK